ncbi:MAG TPA: helix-turn-helix transcriptional regulator, partial [Pyrinomonadaceae bacterium]
MANVTHWTERSAKDFLYSIASDFIEQLQERMEAIPMKQSELARAAKVSKGYVSKMFKNPGNLSLETIVK